MNKKNKAVVVVAGSIAFDVVMNFPGRFSAHIIPGKIHDLSLSFVLNRLTPGFGGTAGNIAYNLALLEERSSILTAVGADFLSYRKHLSDMGVDLKAVTVDDKNTCASAFIITDSADNQISGFYPGSEALAKFKVLDKTEISYLIISPDNKKRMMAAQKWAKKRKIKYIFDPGQQVVNFNQEELELMISGAEIVIGNDYEIEIIKQTLKLKSVNLINSAKSLIITKGSQGSEIVTQGKHTLIPAVNTDKALDPTGAGDAYRAGLIKGLSLNLDLKQAAYLASAVAVYAVEKKGTQNHKFTLNTLRKRLKSNFNISLELT
ncbi:MAG: carbohydrate kinase family protein [Patescibacteria group bacterium]|nr:carbohydrate kinase family protein [Patescibacteria group bacterium]